MKGLRHNLLFCFILILIIDISSNAQSVSIKGRLVDSSAGLYLKDAAVMLLSAKDSFIIADTRTDSEGAFQFSNIADTALYLLFVTYPTFASHSLTLDFSRSLNGVLDLKEIGLLSQDKVLEQVVIKSQNGPFRIKGDTVEYNAKKYVLPSNATVEDLLKVLPGLEVDDKGQIKAQGQKIDKVLIDGEEYFSDDPLLVTRDVRSDMVDKVQVYDKKSKESLFTGILDGVKERVINLKLKEDRTNGVFGKLEVGGATNNHYTGQGMINLFKAKRKAAFYFITNNIGQAGLSSSDMQKLGASGGSGGYDGKGLPRSTSWGAHYDNKWNRDRSLANADYNSSMYDVEGVEQTFSQNNIPGNIIRRNSVNFFSRSDLGQKVNVKYSMLTDSSSRLEFYASSSYNRSKDFQEYNGADRNGLDNLLNTMSTTQQQTIDKYNCGLDVLWQKKLKKYDRTITIGWKNSLNNAQGESNYSSLTDFFNGKLVKDSTRTLNLLKKITNHSRKLAIETRFTEKLTNLLSIELKYNADQAYTDDDNRSYPLLTGPSQQFDPNFTTIQTNNAWTHQGAFALQYSLAKFKMRLNGAGGMTNLHMNEKFSATFLNRQFSMWKPGLELTYRINSSDLVKLGYNGSTKNPEFQQLLPYAFYNTQLSSYLPNTRLKNSFSNSFFALYQAFRQLTGASTFVTASYTADANPITLAMDIDQSGAYVLQYRNMNGCTGKDYSVSGLYAWGLKRLKLNMGIILGTAGGNTFNYINNRVNERVYASYTVELNVAKVVAKKYSVKVVFLGSYNSNELSGATTSSNNFFSYNIKPSFDWYFLKKVQLHTNASYVWQEKSQVFTEDFDQLLWNAWIGSTLLKNNRLMLKFTCNDILNANTGFSRTGSATFFTESRYNTIRRYFMLSASWSFDKFKRIKEQ